MKTSILKAATLLGVLLFLVPLHGQINPEWTTPQKPFRIAGNLYYVGSRDLASYLIVTPAGNILINGNLQTSPPQIRAGVEALGFRWADTKILLNGQAHFDHSAGNAAILRQTGAKLMVMDADVSTMESGGRDDFAHLPRFPPAHVSRILHDGSRVTLGGVTLTAHKTAGHTRGCTTWTMQVKDDHGRILNVVIVGGFTALDSYRLVSTPGHPKSYPEIARDFKLTFATLQSLPCDIFLGAHGSYFNMRQKLREATPQGDSRWIDPAGYRRAVNEAQQAFELRLKQQEKSTQ
jgi:metallo-beta-lactamase class B